jgi:hypothetical protein
MSGNGRLEEFSENLLRFVFVFLLTLAISSILSMIPDGNSGAEPTSCKKLNNEISDLDLKLDSDTRHKIFRYYVICNFDDVI